MGQLGLEEREVKVYLATLELGESTVLPISKKAGIKRTYCYDILDVLSAQGVVSYTEIRGRRRYSALEPKALRRILEQKLKDLDQVLPELESLYQNAPHRPRVRYFQGQEGIHQLYGELLSEAKEVRFLVSVADWARRFPDYSDYAKRLVAKGILIKELARSTDRNQIDYSDSFTPGIQEIRFLPKEMIFQTDNMLWNNKLVMISYGADLHAVSIESAEISQTWRALFESLWQSAK